MSKLLLAFVSGETQLDVIVIDSHCPNADVGGGAFGEVIFSHKIV